ncbi:SpoIID/LytB domain protein [Motilibacter rhizosphaerae]|uniref:SpoIID/LytB domain protein n=1 Tax=Motilibacter rhizosphaerae TaxID=598652 RepID=A0A4Q7NUU0_9ACTN|nr:SpoIID/LytB domain-containing protein [Motilibacter rhizosphaerae]RZS90192.1 SpoIID/LytB domain protein [Motilibacter rhizosphaerae]
MARRPSVPFLLRPALLGGALAALLAGVLVPATPAGAAGVRLQGASSVTVTGAGFGHGVGLSQYGAYGMASEGATAEQILTHYYTGVQVAPVADARDVRVNVAHEISGLALSVLQVIPGQGGAWRLTLDGTPLDLGPTDTVTVAVASSTLTVHVAHADGTSADLTGASLQVEWGGGRGALADQPATVLQVAGDQLRHGLLTVVPSASVGGSRGRLEAVTTLSLHDEYLYGLAEVPSSWPAEALRAQAVAARSYALSTILAKPGGTRACACDVYDTDASQVFRGWRKEAEASGGVSWGAKWVAAVDATDTDPGSALAVLDAGGSPVKTYYFSSSGGATRNSEWVWSTPLAYAKSVDDHWSLSPKNPNSSWTVQLDAGRVASAFGLGSLSALAVTAKDGSGAATQLTARDDAGATRTLGGEAFRSALGLKASWITGIALAPAAGSTPPPVVSPPPAPVVVPPTLAVPYTSAGERTYRGRAWRTTCSTFRTTKRCTAQSRTSWYAADPHHRGRVVRRTGFALSAVADTVTVSSTSGWAAWAANAYAHSGAFEDATGRTWTVACDVETGPRLCSAKAATSVLARATVSGKTVWKRTTVMVVRRWTRLLQGS